MRPPPGHVGGGRSTRQKRALAAILDLGGEFRSAQELHAQLCAAGESTALTTVYSQLRALAEAGAVDVVRSEDGEARYRRCESETHHHHLVCRLCGRTVEVAGPAVEQWADHVAAVQGFVDVRHTFEIIGTCGPCAEDAVVPA